MHPVHPCESIIYPCLTWNRFPATRRRGLFQTSPDPAPHDGADHSRVKQVLFQVSTSRALNTPPCPSVTITTWGWLWRWPCKEGGWPVRTPWWGRFWFGTDSSSARDFIDTASASTPRSGPCSRPATGPGGLPSTSIWNLAATRGAPVPVAGPLWTRESPGWWWPLRDPNPLVAGKGMEWLTSAGLEVTAGVREDEARRLNEAFAKYIACRKPFVTVKVGATLDGRIAAPAKVLLSGSPASSPADGSTGCASRPTPSWWASARCCRMTPA